MMREKHGRIVLLGSLTASAGFRGSPVYAMVKAGFSGLVKGLAADYGRYGITANVVSPAAVETERFAERVGGNAAIREAHSAKDCVRQDSYGGECGYCGGSVMRKTRLGSERIDRGDPQRSGFGAALGFGDLDLRGLRSWGLSECCGLPPGECFQTVMPFTRSDRVVNRQIAECAAGVKVRAGLGRPRKKLADGQLVRMPHARLVSFEGRTAFHVTLRCSRGVPSLRSRRRFSCIKRAVARLMAGASVGVGSGGFCLSTRRA
jgi:hypothetical protein